MMDDAEKRASMVCREAFGSASTIRLHPRLHPAIATAIREARIEAFREAAEIARHDVKYYAGLYIMTGDKWGEAKDAAEIIAANIELRGREGLASDGGKG